MKILPPRRKVREVGKVDKGRLVKKLGKINLNTQKEVVAVLLEMFAE